MGAKETTVIYVPADGSWLRGEIRAGSGIVGTPIERGFVRIDYEGAIYGQANMHRYEDRVLHAHGRHVAGYPTAARMAVEVEELVPVGFVSHTGEVVVVREDLADAWCEQVPA